MHLRSRRLVPVLALVISLWPSWVSAQTTPRPKAPDSWATALVASVSARLSPAARDLADEIYRKLAPTSSPGAIGNAAVGLWMVGRLQPALHLMGKALTDDPADIDNRCNYAAMLTMSGGADLAIPVLEALAQKFPQNSTVLNNLGQAYYLAEQPERSAGYLARAVAASPDHPQAAFTLSYLEEEKGNDERALELAKQSIRRSLSLDKQNRLRKLRYKLRLGDLGPHHPADPDPLGLENFNHPAFPTNAREESRTRGEWAAFYQAIGAQLEALIAQRHALQAAVEAPSPAALAQLRSASLEASHSKADITVQPFARRARLMLDLLNKDGGTRSGFDRAQKALQAYVEEKRKLVNTDYHAEYNKLLHQEAALTGEGTGNPDFCPQFIALADTYLERWSNGRAALFSDYLKLLRRKLGEEVYWKQFMQPTTKFKITVIDAQIVWLGAFVASGIGTDGSMGIEVAASCLADPPAKRGTPLVKFNDVNCQYHSELNLGFGSIVINCNEMVSTLGIGPVKLGLKQDMDQGASFAEEFVSCSIEVRAGKSADVDLGPVSVEVGAEAGLGIEIGRDGVQDVYVVGKVEATVMQVVGSGAEGRMSLMSGSSSAHIL